MVNARRAMGAIPLAVVLALMAACDSARPAPASSSTGTPPSSAGDAGPGVISDAGTAPDSGLYEGTVLCEGTPQLGEVVPETELEGYGEAAGGTIALGTYYLSELGMYVGERDGSEELGRTGFVERGTLIVTTDTIRRASARGASEADLPADELEGFTYQLTDKTLELTATCPNPGGPTFSVHFDASPSRLTLYEGNSRRIYTLVD